LKLNKNDKRKIIELIEAGKPLPSVYKSKLFVSDDTEFIEATKDYKLVYKGKARKEDIIANTPSAPLQKVRSFNSDNAFENDWSNMLIFGDNLLALKAIYEDQRGPNIYKTKNKIKLIYIDPPFATKQDFMKDREKAYRDKIIGAQFIEFLRKRLILLREILADDGSIYVHLDWKKGHYIKTIMDEVFGEHNFQRELIWTLKGASGYKSLVNNFVRGHDTIFFYSKGSNFGFNKYYLPYNEAQLKRFTKKDKDGRIYKPITKTRRIYLDEAKGVPITDVWDDLASFQTIVNSPEITKYPTQKPESLIHRIIQASSNEGEIVLDAFIGSGTTASISGKMGRKWIGIDCGRLAIYTSQKRLIENNESKREFTLYNAGIYDNSKILELDFDHYKSFVTKLFGVREYPHKIHGFNADGHIGTNPAFIWDYPNQKNLILDHEYVKTLHEVLGGKAGDKFYVVAPVISMGFMEDEIKIGDTTYVFLKVPLSVLRALIEKGEPGSLKQPVKEADVNEVIDAVGFDFISQPVVKANYHRASPKNIDIFNANDKDFIIEVTEFKSDTLVYDPEDFENFETFSMAMVDLNYNDDYFNLDQVFWSDETVDEDKSKAIIRIPEGDFTGNKMMVIFMDKYGNELKVVKKKKDFK